MNLKLKIATTLCLTCFITPLFASTNLPTIGKILIDNKTDQELLTVSISCTEQKEGAPNNMGANHTFIANSDRISNLLQSYCYNNGFVAVVGLFNPSDSAAYETFCGANTDALGNLAVYDPNSSRALLVTMNGEGKQLTCSVAFE